MTSTTYLAQKLLTNTLVRKWSRWSESLEDEECLAGYQKLTTTDRIIKADALTTTREVAEELSVDQSMVTRPLKQTGKVKKLDK